MMSSSETGKRKRQDHSPKDSPAKKKLKTSNKEEDGPVQSPPETTPQDVLEQNKDNSNNCSNESGKMGNKRNKKKNRKQGRGKTQSQKDLDNSPQTSSSELYTTPETETDETDESKNDALVTKIDARGDAEHKSTSSSTQTAQDTNLTPVINVHNKNRSGSSTKSSNINSQGKQCQRSDYSSQREESKKFLANRQTQQNRAKKRNKERRDKQMKQKYYEYDGVQIAKRPKGLPNIGNTCYMNATLQCLCWSPLFGLQLKQAQAIIQKTKSRERRMADGITTCMEKLTSEMHVSVEKTIQDIQNLESLLIAVRNVNDQFIGYQQQDSFEIFNTLIHGIENEWSRHNEVVKEGDGDHKDDECGPVSRLFEGKFLITYYYRGCEHTQRVFQKFTSLSIPFLEAKTTKMTNEPVSKKKEQKQFAKFNFTNKMHEQSTLSEKCNSISSETKYSNKHWKFDINGKKYDAREKDVERKGEDFDKRTDSDPNIVSVLPTETTETSTPSSAESKPNHLLDENDNSTNDTQRDTSKKAINVTENPHPTDEFVSDMSKSNSLIETREFQNQINVSNEMEQISEEEIIRKFSLLPCKGQDELTGIERGLKALADPETFQTKVLPCHECEKENKLKADDTNTKTKKDATDADKTPRQNVEQNDHERNEDCTENGTKKATVTQEENLQQFQKLIDAIDDGKSITADNVNGATENNQAMETGPNEGHSDENIFKECHKAEKKERDNNGDLTPQGITDDQNVQDQCRKDNNEATNEESTSLNSSQDSPPLDDTKEECHKAEKKERDNNGDLTPQGITDDQNVQDQCRKDNNEATNEESTSLNSSQESPPLDDTKEEEIDTCVKLLRLLELPPVLVFQVNRFKQVGFRLQKIQGKVSYPLSLDVGQFCSSEMEMDSGDIPNTQYSLYGVVNHSGSIHGGHYSAIIKTTSRNISYIQKELSGTSSKDQDENFQEMAEGIRRLGNDDGTDSKKTSWFSVNDSNVREIHEDSVTNNVNAYLLMYEKKAK